MLLVPRLLSAHIGGAWMLYQRGRSLRMAGRFWPCAATPACASSMAGPWVICPGHLLSTQCRGPAWLITSSVCPSMMERVVHMGVVHAGFSDHDALIVQVHRGRPMDCAPPVVRPPRMDGAERLKRWSEEVLTLYADGFRKLTNQASSRLREMTSWLAACYAWRLIS